MHWFRGQKGPVVGVIVLVGACWPHTPSALTTYAAVFPTSLATRSLYK